MLNEDHSGGRDGSTKVEFEAQVSEDDGASAQVAPQVELRDPEQEGLPDGHEGTGGERQGESQAAVEPGPDESVDVQPDRGEGEPAAEAGLVRVRVALDGPTAYGDWPEIPHRLATRFDIFVFSAKAPAAILHPSVDGSVYDGEMVSDTIRTLKVWEVPQTILMLAAFKVAAPETVFLDIGSSVGWYTMLAMSQGVETVAIDGDPRMLEAIRRSAKANEADFPGADLFLLNQMVDESFSFNDPYLDDDNYVVKIDVEGAENHAVRALMPILEARRVSHLFMEVSPVFEDYYPDLLSEIADLGYEGWMMPAKRSTPPTVRDIPSFLHRHCFRFTGIPREAMADFVSSMNQFDVVFTRPGAEWA